MQKNFEKENFRFYILTRYKLGITATQITKELDTAWGVVAPSIRTVRTWLLKFKSNDTSLKDKSGRGRSITALTNHNIKAVKAVIDQNPYANYDEIEHETSLSRGSIFTILHHKLDLRKITSRWVPHLLTEHNKKERVRICQENLSRLETKEWRLCDIITGDEAWFYLRPIAKKQQNKSWVKKGESPRTVVKRDRYEKKFMFTLFFKSDGPIHVSYLNKGETMDHAKYIESTLKPLVESIKLARPKCGTKNVKIHHDNAKPHVHGKVIDFLIEEDLTIMDHPPYSPDLAPCDFWLNSYVKDRLVEQPDVEALNASITAILGSIPKYEYLKTYQTWIERMKLCIKYKGDYFEHIIK